MSGQHRWRLRVRCCCWLPFRCEIQSAAAPPPLPPTARPRLRLRLLPRVHMDVLEKYAVSGGGGWIVTAAHGRQSIGCAAFGWPFDCAPLLTTSERGDQLTNWSNN